MRLNRTILNKTLKEKFSREYLKFFKIKIKAQIVNFLGCSETILRRTFIALDIYIRKYERSKINCLSFQLKKKIEKESKFNPKYVENKQTIRIRAETETEI